MISRILFPGRGRCVYGILLLMVLCMPAGAFSQSPPAFSLSFSPNTIGPGSIAALQFTIVNSSGTSVTELAFIDTLPAGVTIATPAQAVSECGGILDAPEGGATITFSDGAINPSSSCLISVNVTASTPGTHTNVSGDLTSSEGNSGPAAADLTVATNRPGFFKSFLPSSISHGGRSTLTFTIDNTANSIDMFNITFTDNLPAGIIVADPPSAATSCFGTFDDSFLGSVSVTGGVIAAQPGSSIIAYGSGGGFNTSGVAAGSSCTVSVDVAALGFGIARNTTGLLTASASSIYGNPSTSGKAGAVLEVTADPLHLDKDFMDDPVAPGGTVTLAFAVTNLDRTRSAANITFSDDLAATLSGLQAIGLPGADPCGPGSSLTGTSLLTLSGGSLAPEETCMFEVTLQVPAGAAGGRYPNTTGSLTAELDGQPGIFAPAADDLFVTLVPLLTKTFLTDPVGTGETATLEFTITNISAASAATDIAFTDNLDAFLGGVQVLALPVSGFCGAGSQMSTYISGGQRYLSMTGGVLQPAGQPGDSCTFSIELTIPAGAAPGTHTNTTSAVTATVDGVTQTGRSVSADLTVVGGPALSKSFIDDPVLPGGTVTLEFTLSNAGEANGDATSITFTDDLTSALVGLVATGLPLSDICGPGSSITGTSNLSFSGGNLAAGETCTFGVPLQVPAGSLPGRYANTTSIVTATVAGLTVTGNPARDDLFIGGLSVSKSFTDDPVIPGATVTLEFTIANTSPTAVVTDIAFSDNLTSALSGLAAIGLPLNDICGAGSTITGATNLIFTGGSLVPSSSCTFAITLQVPAGAPPGIYGNTTSQISATFDTSGIVLDPATDGLVVDADFLRLTKSFTTDPAMPGGTVNLEFTLANLHPGLPVTDISFSDDLDAALAGLAANGLPVSACGGTLSGTSLLSFIGGTLAPGASCIFSVELQVPTGLESGTTAANITSQVAGLINGLPVTGDPAGDELKVSYLTLAKAFSGKTRSGETVTLQFTLHNGEPANTADDLRFSDDLGAMFPGLAATGLPVSNVCGTGSLLSGTSLITMSGGNLGAGESCTFNVVLQTPAGAPHGFFLNTTSPLTVQGIEVASPASALLEVDNDPDQDGIPDQTDNCPDISNPDQADNDGDGQGDACDPDDDNDKVPDSSDNCQFTPNPDQADFDGDTRGNVCDADDDNDGLPDSWEIANGLNPYDPSDANRDDDRDGFTNAEEYRFGSDPKVFDPDSNTNGVPDSVDARRGTLPSLWNLLNNRQ